MLVDSKVLHVLQNLASIFNIKKQPVHRLVSTWSVILGIC